MSRGSRRWWRRRRASRKCWASSHRRPSFPARDLAEILERIATAAAPVAAAARGDAITVAQVRKLSAWAHLTAAGAAKVAIVENADRMQDSARNALLKLLEEPPAAVHLVLLTTRKAAIIPTVLSRLRPYAFRQRPAAEEKEVLAKIFRQDPPVFDSLRAFFLAWREINPEKLAALAATFLNLVGAETAEDIVENMAEILSAKAGRDKLSREIATSFLEELLGGMHARMQSGAVAAEILEQWVDAAREAHQRLETFNMSPATVVESLFFRMRSVLHGERGAIAPTAASTGRAGAPEAAR